MVSAQQVTGQQTEVVPYQGGTVITQGFLDMMSIIPTMMIMFFMVMLMGLMRDMMQPGGAKKVVAKGAELAAPALAFIPYAGPALAGGALAVGKALEEKKAEE
jgi:hypothetical protein